MTTLSACLVVHCEEAAIAQCIDSFCDLADEIVIVHDGPCSDRTLEIAAGYTDRIYERPARAGSAELVRPFALAQCTSDWVLVLDADERVSQELRSVLRSLIDRSDVDAYGFEWPYVDATGARVAGRFRGKKFLFRREQMYSIGLPHMPPESYGRCKSLTLAVHHLLPKRSVAGHFRSLLVKNRQRARVAASKLFGGADRVDTFNARIDDPRVKNVRKLRWLTRRPLFALLTLPLYGFCYWYFAHGYWRDGWIGLRDALELPAYYAAFAWNMLRLRLIRQISFQANG